MMTPAAPVEKASTIGADHGQPNDDKHDPAPSAAAAALIDSFAVTADDLHPLKRLLRVVKSGERVPVTLRATRKETIVGLRLAIPPIGSSTTHLYGIEYDDASRGKHEGVYGGEQLFEPRQKGKGAGAFLLSAKDLRRGYTFAEALAERYGVEIPGVKRLRKSEESAKGPEAKGISLGTTRIIVEAPGLDEVRKRMAHLQRLQSIGLEAYDVCGVGGNQETRDFLRDNLTSLTTLDLSNNLFTYWKDVADIVACIPTLQKIILNNSRIERLGPHPRDFKAGISTEELIRESISTIREVELCISCLSWGHVLEIAPFLPHLERLDLVDNTPLTVFGPMRTEHGVPIFLSLRYLNLAGCGIVDWEALARAIGTLKTLETLDLSRAPLSLITPPPPTSSVRLPNLILLSTTVSSWTSIDNLRRWIGDSLISLKFTLSPSASPDPTLDPSLLISGNQAADRLIHIAKLPSLTVLNSTLVSAAERRDAEMGYVKMVDRIVAAGKGNKADWGRYEELRQAHEMESAGAGAVNLKLGHLRSRLYDLSVYIAGPNSILQHTTSISILPSSPVVLLRKTLLKALKAPAGQAVRIWTVTERFAEGQRRKAVEVPDGETVGWWFADGDEVIVEI